MPARAIYKRATLRCYSESRLQPQRKVACLRVGTEFACWHDPCMAPRCRLVAQESIRLRVEFVLIMLAASDKRLKRQTGINPSLRENENG